MRQDGFPYPKQALPADKGVAIYFTLNSRQMCFACDRWDKVQDNIYAIAMTIEALRGIERWGSGSMVEQAFTGFVALPAPKSPHDILGVRPARRTTKSTWLIGRRPRQPTPTGEARMRTWQRSTTPGGC